MSAFGCQASGPAERNEATRVAARRSRRRRSAPARRRERPREECVGCGSRAAARVAPPRKRPPAPRRASSSRSSRCRRACPRRGPAATPPACANGGVRLSTTSISGFAISSSTDCRQPELAAQPLGTRQVEVGAGDDVERVERRRSCGVGAADHAAADDADARAHPLARIRRTATSDRSTASKAGPSISSCSTSSHSAPAASAAGITRSYPIFPSPTGANARRPRSEKSLTWTSGQRPAARRRSSTGSTPASADPAEVELEIDQARRCGEQTVEERLSAVEHPQLAPVVVEAEREPAPTHALGGGEHTLGERVGACRVAGGVDPRQRQLTRPEDPERSTSSSSESSISGSRECQPAAARPLASSQPRTVVAAAP